MDLIVECEACGERVIRGKNPSTRQEIMFDREKPRLYSLDPYTGNAELVGDWGRLHGLGMRPAIPHARTCRGKPSEA